MWLLIDAGNTRIKWALAAPGAPAGGWLAHGMLAHGAAHEGVPAWQQAARQRGIEGSTEGGTEGGTEGIEGVWLANVAGMVVRQHLETVLQQALPGVPLHWFASSSYAAGLTNGYRNPAQLGCDRFAAAIGARTLFPGQNLLVANCGTATTLDAVSAEGCFVGGMILPGLATMAQALHRQTAQLPQVDQSHPPRLVLADNTDDAIISGCLAAQVGAIMQAIGLSQGPLLCILSGGAAAMIGALLRHPHQVVPHLVLHGLQSVAQATLTHQLDGS
jgi:type III pantothenate kinase